MTGMPAFKVMYGLAKQTSIVIDQSAFHRPEPIWMDDYHYCVSEMRYAWRQPLIDANGQVDLNGIIGLLREHDLVVNLLLRDLRDTRARLDLALDFLCANYSREAAPLMAPQVAALVVEMHDERDRQKTRREWEATVRAKIAAGGD